MATNSKIKWTNHTFNPWRGCTMVSAGCANCYAETLSKRNPDTLGIWGKDGTRVIASDKAWAEPLRWNDWARLGVCLTCKGKGTWQLKSYRVTVQGEEKERTVQTVRCDDCNGVGRIAPYRAKVFCASLADVFEDWDTMPAFSVQSITLARARLWQLVESTPFLDWQLLTKRPQNISKFTPDQWWDNGFPPNVWMGVTVENQKAAEERIPDLLDVPARVRFLSCEPLLEEVNILEILFRHKLQAVEGINPLDLLKMQEALAKTPWLHWVIVGGESGPKARKFHVEWARSLKQQCISAGVQFFMKQLGEVTIVPVGDGELKQDATIELNHTQIGDMNWFPPDLQVQNFPEVKP